MSRLPVPANPSSSALARELRAVADRSNEIRAQSKAKNTLKAYKAAWDTFVAWCDVVKKPALPADPRTIALYLVHLEREGLSFSTVSLVRAAIVFAHRKNKAPLDAEDPYLAETMEGLANTLGIAPENKKKALDGDLLKLVVAPLGTKLIEKRDRALLTVGWFGAYRRSELSALTVADIEVSDDGIRATTRRSKTDQQGKGYEKPLPYASDPKVCPVRALRTWLESASIAEGPLFRPVDRHDHVAEEAITGHGIAFVIKRLCERAGLNPEEFSGHSLRAGFITTAAARHKDLDAIMRQTGHLTAEVVRGYIRHVQLFEHSAAVGLL